MRLLILLAAIPLLGVGCSEFLVTNAKNTLFRAADSGFRIIRESGEGFTRNLTQEQKAAVDEWLSSNRLNEFGDAQGTFYAGGTPLFNEATGETLDRFKYLFEKFPELKRVIEMELKKQADQY
ncbi:MAG: hypothetical protein HYT31_01255 [Parcubacteria group bacterium]|nr:hypothetical protein [Parcubacteria group bacterium]